MKTKEITLFWDRCWFVDLVYNGRVDCQFQDCEIRYVICFLNAKNTNQLILI